MSWQLRIILTSVPWNHFLLLLTSIFFFIGPPPVERGAEHAAGRPGVWEDGAGALLVEGGGGAGCPRGGARARTDLSGDWEGERRQDSRNPAESAQWEGEELSFP